MYFWNCFFTTTQHVCMEDYVGMMQSEKEVAEDLTNMRSCKDNDMYKNPFSDIDLLRVKKRHKT